MSSFDAKKLSQIVGGVHTRTVNDIAALAEDQAPQWRDMSGDQSLLAFARVLRSMVPQSQSN